MIVMKPPRGGSLVEQDAMEKWRAMGTTVSKEYVNGDEALKKF
jgi:hypothetical protein